MTWRPTSHAARRGSLRKRTVKLAVAAFVAVASILGLPFAGALGIPAASADQSDLSIRVGVKNAGNLEPGKDITFVATVTNRGTHASKAGTLSIGIGNAPFSSRSALTSWLEGKSNAAYRGAHDAGEDNVDALDPGASTRIEITLPSDANPITDRSAFGGRAVLATLSSGRQILATEHSSAVLTTANQPPKTGTTLVVPITVPGSDTALITANDLESLTSPGGSLANQLDAVQGSHVALGIDPRIIASIRVLGTKAPKSATDWLQKLATSGLETFPLQYGDADPAAEAQSLRATGQGGDRLLAPTGFSFATEAESSPQPTTTATATPTSTGAAADGASNTSDVLAFSYTRSDIAWPAAKTVATGDMDVFAASGLSTTILDSQNLAESKAKFTESATATIANRSVLTSDSEIAANLSRAVTATSDTAHSEAVNRALSVLATVGTEQPESERMLLVALPRTTTTTPTLLKQTIAEFDGAGWNDPSPLSKTTQAGAHEAELSSSEESKARIDAISNLRSQETQLQSFATITAQPDLVTSSVRATILPLMSIAWRSDDSGWNKALAARQKATASMLSSVQVADSSQINFVASQASIPIKVKNALDQPVTVTVRATPSNGRLKIEHSQTVTIQPGTIATVQLPARTITNGDTSIDVSLESANASGIGTPTTIKVLLLGNLESTLLIIGSIVVALLLVFGVIRTVLKHRRAKAAASAEAEEEGAHEHPSADEGADARPASHARDPRSRPRTPAQGDNE